MQNANYQTNENALFDSENADSEETRLSELEPIELILDRMMDAEPEPG